MPPSTRRLLCLATLLFAAGARGEPSPYYVGISQALLHDSNLLRLADDAGAQPGFYKADTMSATSLLGGFDQPVGRQRLFGNLALRENRFKNNDQFDNRGYSLAAGIDAETVERVSGSLRFEAARNLAKFNSNVADSPVLKKNLQTTRALDAVARLGSATELAFEGSAGVNSIDYSALEYRNLTFRQNRVGLGLHWQPGSGASLGLGLREARGRLPYFAEPTPGDIVADHFTRRDLDAEGVIEPGGASALTLRLSWARIEYDSAQRNFAGVTGLVRWVWQPSAKLRFETQLQREPGQDSYFNGQDKSDPNRADTVQFSRITDSLRVQARWDLTAKIGLNAGVGRERRALSVSKPPDPQPVAGTEHWTSSSLGTTWAPLRPLQLGCSWARERRHGAPPLTGDFRDATYTCFGQLTLQ